MYSLEKKYIEIMTQKSGFTILKENGIFQAV